MNKKTTIKMLSVMFVLASWLPILTYASTLKTIDTTILDNGSTEFLLKFNDAVPVPKSYQINKPPKFFLDFPLTDTQLKKHHQLDLELIDSLTLIQNKTRTRLIFNLKKTSNFFTKIKGKNLYIYMNNEQGIKPRLNSEFKTNNSSSTAPHNKTNLSDINYIDFKKDENNNATVLIGLNNRNISLNSYIKNNKIILNMKGSVLPNKLQNRLDVTEFGTLVQFIDANNINGSTVIEIINKNSFEHFIYQTDQLISINIKSKKNNSQNKIKNKIFYNGDNLSLSSQSIKIREVLQTIADFKGLNLVASDSVTGNITLRLKDVPWDQALDIVMKSKGLDKRINGNVLTIAPAEELASREQKQLENAQKIRDLAPLVTDLIQINYASAINIAKVLSVESSNNRSILTHRGSVQVMERNNSLLIKDTQHKLNEINRLIKKLDIPVRQVMIEARIVNIDTSAAKSLGVKWGGGIKINNKINIGGISQINSNSTTSPNTQASEGSNTSGTPILDFGIPGKNVATIAMGFSSNSSLLNLELSALISDNIAEAVSQPKLITANKKTAVIKSGVEIPYEEKTSGGNTSIAFKDAVLSLKVTPQITPDGRIIMDVNLSNDSQGNVVNGVPLINKNEINTQVLVKNGDTVVLGGIFKENKENGSVKVPLLGDLPLIGALFKNKTTTNNKQELMIFITPKIINNNF